LYTHKLFYAQLPNVTRNNHRRGNFSGSTVLSTLLQSRITGLHHTQQANWAQLSTKSIQENAATRRSLSVNLRPGSQSYLWVGRNKAESFRDLCRGGTTTDVEKICRFTAVQFDDIHRRHRKTRSIYC